MKRVQILFIQGGGKGAYEEDKKLVSSLQDALEEQHDIHFPKMPKENDPSYELFEGKIDKELKTIKDKVVLIGHSLGACYLLKYLTEAKIDKHIAGMFLISTPFWGKGGWQYEGFTLNNDLASKRTVNIPLFFYHSNDDEIVPFSHLTLYEEKFPHAKIRKIVGRGHQLKNDVSEIVHDLQSLEI